MHRRRAGAALTASLLAAAVPLAGPAPAAISAQRPGDRGVCSGVPGCRVKAYADVDGDGTRDVVALASRSAGTRRSVVVRVKTGPGRVVSVRRPAPYWPGRLWHGVARLDGRPGREVVVGYTAGAHTLLFRALTWRAGTLTTLGAPGPGTAWAIDGALSVSLGWQRTAGEPVGTVRRRYAVRTGNPASSPFRGTVTRYRWTAGGWDRVGSRTVNPMRERVAYGWGGFSIPGLPRW